MVGTSTIKAYIKTFFNGLTQVRSQITHISRKRGDMHGVIQHKKYLSLQTQLCASESLIKCIQHVAWTSLIKNDATDICVDSITKGLTWLIRWLNKSFLNRATTLSLAEENNHARSAVHRELKHVKWKNMVGKLFKKSKPSKIDIWIRLFFMLWLGKVRVYNYIKNVKSKCYFVEGKIFNNVESDSKEKFWTQPRQEEKRLTWTEKENKNRHR